MEKAAAYDDLLARLTRQATPGILDTFGDLSTRRFLDVFCGTGHPAEAASRGANAEGIDFAKAMVEKAAHNYPHVLCRDGDAENLPYGNEELDALVCLFGILYVERD